MFVVYGRSKAEAVDISVGATTWYAWWDFKDGGESLIDSDPTFLFGPILSVKFSDDFNLTFVYLYGKFDAKGVGSNSNDKYESKRYDLDLALNYRLNDYFKLFTGMKSLGYDISCDGETILDYDSIGPGLGLSAVYPVADNLFLLGTLSGFHLWGKFKSVGYSATSNKYKDYGFNSTLSLAYYIAPASTTISLGGRYQYIKQDFKDSLTDTRIHKFYGATLTATYSFSI